MKGSTIVSFVLGACVGGGAGFVITKSICNKQREEELEPLRNTLKDLLKKIDKLEKEASAHNGEQEDPAVLKKRNDEAIESIVESVKSVAEKHKYVNYSDVDDGKKTDDTGSPVKEEIKKRIDIERITEDQWKTPPSKYKSFGITYYRDGVFTDDDDKEMDEGYLSETIGIDIRDEIVESKQIGTVWVRNHKTLSDYEILCIDESWKEVHEVD